MDSLARPGGNATGFMFVDYGMGGKWLDLLKEIAPGVQRAAVIRDPALAVGIGQLASIQAAAASFRVDITPIDAREADAIERSDMPLLQSLTRSGHQTGLSSHLR